MANRKELGDALRKASAAVESWRRVKMLPRRKGARVLWSNGVVWKRSGDDDWRPDDFPRVRYSSAHVASMDWREVGRWK